MITMGRWLALAGAITLGVAAVQSYALADAPRISASLYPAHTRITQFPSLTNQQMDCDWGFACQNGQAVTSAQMFHLRTEDDLHRLSGWAQFGDTR
jgi:hypothetical protein